MYESKELKHLFVGGLELVAGLSGFGLSLYGLRIKDISDENAIGFMALGMFSLGMSSDGIRRIQKYFSPLDFHQQLEWIDERLARRDREYKMLDEIPNPYRIR